MTTKYCFEAVIVLKKQNPDMLLGARLLWESRRDAKTKKSPVAQMPTTIHWTDDKSWTKNSKKNYFVKLTTFCACACAKQSKAKQQRAYKCIL